LILLSTESICDPLGADR